jgi:hypothetical protein
VDNERHDSTQELRRVEGRIPRWHGYHPRSELYRQLNRIPEEKAACVLDSNCVQCSKLQVAGSRNVAKGGSQVVTGISKAHIGGEDAVGQAPAVESAEGIPKYIRPHVLVVELEVDGPAWHRALGLHHSSECRAAGVDETVAVGSQHTVKLPVVGMVLKL